MSHKDAPTVIFPIATSFTKPPPLGRSQVGTPFTSTLGDRKANIKLDGRYLTTLPMSGGAALVTLLMIGDPVAQPATAPTTVTTPTNRTKRIAGGPSRDRTMITSDHRGRISEVSYRRKIIS
jgi:hypothetical protein